MSRDDLPRIPRGRRAKRPEDKLTRKECNERRGQRERAYSELAEICRQEGEERAAAFKHHKATAFDQLQKRYTPTAEQRAHVTYLAALGLKREEIRHLIINPATGKGISERILTQHFAEELKVGPVVGQRTVGDALFNQAVAGDTRAAIWIEKTRYGIMPPAKEVEVRVDAGVLVPPTERTVEEWIDEHDDGED